MNDQTPMSTDVEVEFQRIFMSNIVTDGWYVLCCIPPFIGVVVLIQLGPGGEAWEWAMDVLFLTVTAAVCIFMSGLVLNCYIFMLTEGDAGKVRSWCRWRLVLAVLMLHAHSRARFHLLLDQIQRQELEDAIV